MVEKEGLTWNHVAHDVSEKEIDEIWDSHDNPQVVAASCGCKLWLQVRSGLKNMQIVVNSDIGLCGNSAIMVLA